MAQLLHPLDLLRGLVDEPGLTSPWRAVSQVETDVFAALTDDRALMHNDPAWAASSPWGGTIVQAYHILALLPREVTALEIPLDDDRNFVLNYGLNRVRILRPLRVGASFRIHTRVLCIEDKGDNRYLVTFEHIVEIEGEEKPFMIAEVLAYFGFDQGLTTSDQVSGPSTGSQS